MQKKNKRPEVRAITIDGKKIIEVNEKVYCIDTKRTKYAFSSYPVIEDGKLCYYSTKEKYEQYKRDQLDKKYWNKCIELIASILGYKKGFAVPTILPKKISELKEYGYDVVYETIKRKQSVLNRYAKQTGKFGTEYNRIAYACGIVKGGLLETYRDKMRHGENWNKSQVPETPTSESIGYAEWVETNKNQEEKGKEKEKEKEMPLNKKSSRDISRFLDLIEEEDE